jgi:putative ABC transport system permease protein
MVSTTVSLYISTDEQLENRCPNDIAITFYNKKGEYQEKAIEKIRNLALEQKRNISNLANYSYLEFSAEKEGDTFNTDSGNYISNSNISDLYFVTADEYERLTGNSKDLNENDVLVYSNEEFEGNSFKIFNNQYNIKEKLEEFPSKSDYTAIFVNVYYIVVKDDETLNEIYNYQLNSFGEDASKFQNYLAFDIDGTREEKVAFADALYNEISLDKEYYVDYFFESKQGLENEFHMLIGGFLFLGLFLGFLFLTATVLIIYYKQISEGFDDRERYDIMQKVGMSRSEVKDSIRGQILKVFYLPLIMAIVHIAAAFKMITKLLLLFNLTNVPLFAVCTAATIAAFALIYFIVYTLTARVYYKIVQ